MTAQLEHVWNNYPESHLHCDVTQIALHTYRIVASLIDKNDKEVSSISLKGSGDLNALKEQAFGLLAAEVVKLPTG